MSDALLLPTTVVDLVLEDITFFGESACESIIFLLADCHEGPVETVVTAEEPGVVRSPNYVQVSERWILQLTDLCEERGEIVVAQVHSHGIEAFHSDTDHHHLFHAPGVVSLVVPYFGRSEQDRSPSAWGCFIGQQGGGFLEVDPTQTIRVESGKEAHHYILNEEGWRD